MLRLTILFCAISYGLTLPEPVLKIVAGENGKIENFKYQVALEHMEVVRCGGTLVAPNIVITASHCLESIYMKEFMVRAGTVARYGKDGVVKPVEKFITHPYYEKKLMIDNDIAVVFLKEPFEYGPTIQPATLPEFNEEPKTGSVVTVSGWGRMAENGDFAKTLQYLDVPVLDPKVCKKSYDYPLTDTMLCAGYLTGKKDACKQDSGGPLVDRNDRNKLIGVVSWAIGCARPKYPGVYARVCKFRKWLDCVMRTGEQCDDPDNKKH